MKKTFLIIIFALCLFGSKSFAQTEPAPSQTRVKETVEVSASETVCLTQTEAKAIYALAAKGAGFDAYEKKAESDIEQRDAQINELKIKYATEAQNSINLNAEIRKKDAELEQYRQFFFTNPPKKCKFAFICSQK